MGKIPCNECGALILPATAENTGGICMACKQGIRKNMEASRAYRENLKNHDPFRELWSSLVERASTDPNLTKWSKQERLYFAISLLEGEVYNGGFEQYFSNSSGDYYQHAVAGLLELGAMVSVGIARDAAETLFGEDGPPPTWSDRRHIMAEKVSDLSEVLARHCQSSRLEGLDKLFCGDPDGLNDRLRAYAQEQGLITPFSKDPYE